MSETLKFGNGEWAVKKGSTLAYNSENGNFKPLPFTFDRSTSATRVNKEGLIEVVTNNKPRIDFLNDSNGALLLEPSRSNLFLYSESLETGWTGAGTNPPVLTASQFISPDGSQDASRLQIPSTGTTSIFYQLFSHTIGTQYTISAYVKSNTSTNQEFKLYGDFGAPTGISGALTATNEWQRFSFTYTATATGIRSGGFYYVPNTAADLQVYGIQVEVGSYSTSYIPTQGAISTRVAENAENLNVSVLPTSYPFTIFTEAKYSSVLEFFPVSFLDNSVSFRYFAIRFKNGKIESLSRPNSEIVLISSSTYTEGQNVSVALKIESTSIKLFVNGVLEASATNTLLFDSSINDLFIGKLRSVSDTGTRIGINSLKIYNTALTDQELINLTTI